MSRTAPPLLLGLTLAIGVALGVALDRGGPFVGGAGDGSRPHAPSLRRPPPRRSWRSPATAGQNQANEDELYRRLDEQYEQFRHINQTFEMVARAVSPAVVHIVAHKTSRAEESRGSATSRRPARE